MCALLIQEDPEASARALLKARLKGALGRLAEPAILFPTLAALLLTLICSTTAEMIKVAEDEYFISQRESESSGIHREIGRGLHD
jgi:hypothetical protein